MGNDRKRNIIVLVCTKIVGFLRILDIIYFDGEFKDIIGYVMCNLIQYYLQLLTTYT